MQIEFQKTSRTAYLNFLRAKHAMLTGEVPVASYPYYMGIDMGIDPTSICQLRCPSCPTGVENESRRIGPRQHLRDRTMMTSDLLTSGLDVLAASVDGFSQETYQIYRPGGNFALVRSNLERLVSLRQKLGLKTEIIWSILVFSFNEHVRPPDDRAGALRRFLRATCVSVRLQGRGSWSSPSRPGSG